MKIRKTIVFILIAFFAFTLCAKNLDDSMVITWKEKKSLPAYAKSKGEMIMCFMAGQELTMTGGSSENAFGETKWGDSCVIAFPNGEVMLIDGGMASYAPLLMKNLEALGIEKIDYLVLSHRHDDHYGGLLADGGVFQTYRDKIGVVISSGILNGAASEANRKKLEEICNVFGIPMAYYRKGDTFSIGKVSVKVLWPLEDEIPVTLGTEDTNSTSLVLRFDYKNVSALFCGDLYVGGESYLIENTDPADLDVDILKMPHHGRNTSSSYSFVKAVTPQVASATGAIIIDPSVYTRYASVGTAVYMDYYDGYVTIRTNGKKITVTTSDKRPELPAYEKVDKQFNIKH